MSSSGDGYLRFACPACDAQLRASPSKAGTKHRCPKCRSTVTVPEAAEATPPAEVEQEQGYAVREATQREPATMPGIDSWAVEPVPAGLPAEVPAAEAVQSEVQSEVPDSTRPSLPPRPMISGIFSLMVQPAAAVCWIVLSVGVTVVLTLVAVAIMGGLFGMAFSGFIGLLGVVWLVAASACGLSILQDSAAGNEIVESWPDAVWLDWIGESLFVLSGLTFTLVAALGVARLFDFLGLSGWVSGPITFWVAFPIVQLSLLETQSRFVPLSPTVWRSLLASWKSWTVFYIETAVLAAAIAGFVLLLVLLLGHGFQQGRLLLYVLLLTISAAGTATVGAGMLYFRLLGRLAWVCAEKSRADEKERAKEEAAEQENKQPPLRPTPIDDF